MKCPKHPDEDMVLLLDWTCDICMGKKATTPSGWYIVGPPHRTDTCSQCQRVKKDGVVVHRGR